jgi:hypothetical protein
VLKSNVAACYLKTEEWKEAVKAAGECLDLLDMAEGKKKKKDKLEKGSDNGKEDAAEEIEEEEEEEADEEIISPGATKAEDTSAKAKRKADIERIRAKALMRRGKARMEIGSWSSLQGAEEGIMASHSAYAISDNAELGANIVQITSCCLQCLIFPLRTRKWYRRL